MQCPGPQFSASAGCVAQQEGDTLLKRFPQLDFVFGTHNLRHVPEPWRARGEEGGVARFADRGEPRPWERFELPDRAIHRWSPVTTPGRAFLTVMEGCDMFCSFCIVPTTRGPRDQPARGRPSSPRPPSSWSRRGCREISSAWADGERLRPTRSPTRSRAL